MQLSPDGRTLDTWSPRAELRPDTVLGLAVGVVALLVVTGLKLLLRDALGEPTPFLLYFVPVLLASLVGGTGAGVLVTIAGGLLAVGLFVSPAELGVRALVLQIAVFALEGVVVSVLGATVQRERRLALNHSRQIRWALRLETILDGVDEGITVQDQSGRLLYANAAAARLVGFDTPEAMVKAGAEQIAAKFEILGEDGLPFPREQLPGRVVLAGGESPEVTLRFRLRETGEERWSSVRAMPLRDEEQGYLALNLFRDLTARRQQSEELRMSQERLSTALRSIGDAVIATDRSGRVGFMNPVAEQLTGWTSEEAEGRPLSEVFPILEEETRSPVESPVEQVLRDSTVVGLANHTVLIRRDGTEISIDDSAAPILDEGRLAGVILVFRDVSARRHQELQRTFLSQAAEEMSSSLDYERTLATVARLAVPTMADWCTIDVLEGGQLRRLAVAHADPEKVAAVEELQRRYPTDLDRGITGRILRTGQPALVRELSPDLLEKGAQSPEHLELLRALQLRSFIGVPLRREDRPVGVISLVMAESNRAYGEADLELALALAERASVALDKARLFSEQVEARALLEQARAEAEAANRSKDEFLAILGHELRNPLAPILTALHVMKIRGGNGLERERAVIERQVRHVVRLVDDLLDVSRITRGTVEIAREPVELADVVSKALEMTSPLIEQRQHEVTVEVPPGLVVNGDPVRLAQILANLVSNAAKFTAPSGRISVRAHAEERQVVLQVQDDGVGIPADLLPRVFDLFTQGGQPLDRAGGGLGLGLAIARRLVGLHGGTLEAHSDGPGTGSTFTVRLPQRLAAPHTPAPQEPLTPVVPAGLRVLIVDDNADALSTLAEALSLLGYETSSALDGPEALLKAAALRPQLALVDIGLPVMDGYEVAQRLRSMPGLEDTRLVALTGYGLASDRARALAAGFDEHLVKPIAIERLQQIIQTLVR
jgi:PAS domain S-box-containing protein